MAISDALLSRLADPDGLLEGTGKGMRHVKVPLGGAVPAG